MQRDIIEFSPPLPSSRQKSLKLLQMGYLDRILLHFPYVFWNTSQYTFGILPKKHSHLIFNHELEFPMIVNEIFSYKSRNKNRGPKVLTCMIGGDDNVYLRK